MDARTLLKEKRDVILAAAKRHGVRNIRIFGSVALGEDDSESDIYFLVDTIGKVFAIESPIEQNERHLSSFRQ